MATSRCVRLMLVAMANDLKEVWISDQPFLLMIYLWQYMPTLAWWLTNKAAKRRIENFKSGVVSPIYTFLNSYQSCRKAWKFPILKNVLTNCLPISWYINKYKRYKRFSIPNAYLSVYCKLLLVLEKVFYKVKIKSKIAIFFFYVAVWPVYVPKCFFSTMSPHKLQSILQVSTFCVTSLGWYLASPLISLQDWVHVSPLSKHFHTIKRRSPICSTGSFDFVPEGQFAHLKCACVRV